MAGEIVIGQLGDLRLVQIDEAHAQIVDLDTFEVLPPGGVDSLLGRFPWEVPDEEGVDLALDVWENNR